MGSQGDVGTIVATAAAQETLSPLSERYGDIILHVTGGFTKTPLCLKATELRLGSRDILLGTVDGIKVYEAQITPETKKYCDDYVLDVVPGVPFGFSLNPGNGMNFVLTRKASPYQREN